MNDAETEATTEQTENTTTEEAREITSEAVNETGVPDAFAEPEAEAAQDATPRVPTNDEAALRVSHLVTGVQKERVFIRTCFDDIPVDRLAEMGQENAELVKKVEDLEEEASRVAKSFKSRIQAIEADIRDRSRTIRTGIEDVEVECVEYFDRDFGRAYVVRNDTGAVVENRPLNEHERQLYMQFPDESSGDDAAEAADGGDEAEASSDDAKASGDEEQTDAQDDKPLSPREARRRAKALRDAATATEGLPAAA